MLQLDEAERRTLLRVAEVLFAPMPGGDALAALGPRELRMAERLDDLLASFPSDADRLAIKATLRLLGSRAGGALLFGRPRAFSELSPLEAERVFLEMLVSPRSLARQTAKLARTLVGVLVGRPLPAADASTRGSPVWDAIGYPGPLGPPPATPRRLRPLRPSKAATWTCDVVIVGSGAGGGVAAGVLARAGLDVVVLERGPYRSERDFTHYQDDADRDLYDVRATSDLGVSVFSGRCVGGGTVVNYATSLRTPDAVRAEWDREAGFRDVFTGADMTRALDAVSERLGVTTGQSRPWPRDRLLAEAGAALGWDVASCRGTCAAAPRTSAAGSATSAAARGPSSRRCAPGSRTRRARARASSRSARSTA